MAQQSDIEWTEATWNPVTGCTKISDGCANCYAERMARRLKAMGQPNYRNGFKVTTHEHMLNVPLSWSRPRTVFVNSMSDLFHPDVPTDFVGRVFDVMRTARQHTFQVLTKRAERMAQIAPTVTWTPNIWAGTTVENDKCLDRIKWLRRVPARVRFLSLEPLLGPLGRLDLEGIHWVIVGGESGPGARPVDKAWVTDILTQCREANVPFFFKQWGGTRKKTTGRVLDGQTYSELPHTVLTDGVVHASG